MVTLVLVTQWHPNFWILLLELVVPLFFLQKFMLLNLMKSQLRFAATAENAAAVIPTPLTISAVGIGTSHSLTTEKQNTKASFSIDNNIRAPVVGTGVTTRLSFNLNNVKSVLTVDDPNQFFGGDLIKIDDEYMKINASVLEVPTSWLLIDLGWVLD